MNGEDDANFEDLNNVQIEKGRNFRVAHFFQRSARDHRGFLVSFCPPLVLL